LRPVERGWWISIERVDTGEGGGIGAASTLVKRGCIKPINTGEGGGGAAPNASIQAEGDVSPSNASTPVKGTAVELR